MSQFTAYQHQMGVPEWDAQQEYYIGSLCTLSGEVYLSLADANIGNTPPSVKWTALLTAKTGLNSSKNFSEIKDAGPTAVSEALANLGLGEAAKRSVGNGANQIPDMSSFSSSLDKSGYQKLPSGFIIQWVTVDSSSGTSGSVTLPISFPNITAVAFLQDIVTPGNSPTIMGMTTTTTKSAVSWQAAAAPGNFILLAIGS
ncbi:hypothetical protein UZ986_21475 [Escherichia coli]|nr:hypothetical protein [Escherichia coli]